MTSTEKQNNEYAFRQLEAHYQTLKLDASKAYYLTLANSSEVHLIKRDATKSVFLGRLHIMLKDDMEKQLAGIWNVLKNYFLTPEPVKKEAEVIKEEVTIHLDDFSNEASTASATPTASTTDEVKTTTKKRASKKIAPTTGLETVAPAKENIPVVETAPATDEGLVVDEEAENAFDDWADKMGV